VQVVDEGRSSVWLQPSTLLAGGGGLVSTARDFIRFAAMLRAEGEYEGRRVMRRETVRLAMSNLLPPDVSYRPTGGFGAGAGVVMPGVVSENGPAGTYSAIGSSSTLVAVDPARRGIAVFLAQLMPPQVGASLGPAGASYRREFNAAVDEDLAARE
jgi:CubicO group peptidase (beta-lactamase class C family)